MTIAPTDLAAAPSFDVPRRGKMHDIFRRHPTAMAGAILLTLLILMAIFAPWLGTVDPQALAPIRRLRAPSSSYWFGTDMLGRDVYSRVIYGSRVSLIIGISVALFSAAVGIALGLLTGFVRLADAILMRIMDGLMSIPSVLLAIALMALTRASMGNVIFAITVLAINLLGDGLRDALDPRLARRM